MKKTFILAALFVLVAVNKVHSVSSSGYESLSSRPTYGTAAGNTLAIGEIQVLSPGANQTLYISSSNDDGGRGALLTSLTFTGSNPAISSSVIRMGPGVYAIYGNKLKFSTGTFLVGAGVDSTVIVSTITSSNGNAIIPWENGHMAYLTHSFSLFADPTLVSGNIGSLAADSQGTSFIHNFLAENVKFVGTNDVLFVNNANKIGFTWKFRNCIFEGHGSDAIAIISATLPGSQIDIDNCYVISTTPPSFGGSFGANCRGLSVLSTNTVVNVWGGQYIVNALCTTINDAIRTNAAGAVINLYGGVYTQSSGTNNFDLDATLGTINYGGGVQFDRAKINGAVRSQSPYVMSDPAPRTNITPNTTGQFIFNSTDFQVCASSCMTAPNCWVVASSGTACAH